MLYINQYSGAAKGLYLLPLQQDSTSVQPSKQQLLQQSVELQKQLLEEEKSRHDLLQLLLQQQHRAMQLEGKRERVNVLQKWYSSKILKTFEKLLNMG